MLITAVTESYSIIASLNITRDELQFISLRELFADSVSRAGTYNELYERIAERIEPKYEDEFRQRFAPDKVELSFAKGRSRIWTDIRLRLDDGIYHWLSIQIIHVRNRNNSKEINAVFLARISDEQKIEEANQKRNLQDALSAAKLANEAKSRFLSNMSHDIRTPLNSIMGMTDILKSHPDDTKQVEEGLDKISMSGRHLLELINDILDMSRIESGKMSLQESGFNIRVMMSELIELVRPQALGSGVQAVIHPCPGSESVRPQASQRTLLNIHPVPPAHSSAQSRYSQLLQLLYPFRLQSCNWHMLSHPDAPILP